MISTPTFFRTLIYFLISGTMYPQNINTKNSERILYSDTLYHKLDSIVVNATRYHQPLFNIPQAVNVLESSSFSNLGKGLSLDQALKYIPGLIISDRNNPSQGDRISLRGLGSRAQFGVRGIKVYLDGIPLTAADGGSQLNNLDVSSVGRIEIIRGPNSVLYGNSAGGVIYLESKNFNYKNYFVEPELISGAYGYKKLRFSGGIKFGWGDVQLSANTLRDDGFRDHSESRSSNFNIISNLSVNENIRLKLVINYFNAPYLLNPSSLNKDDALNRPAMVRRFVVSQGSGKKVEQGQGGLTFRYSNDYSSLETTIYGLFRQLFNPVPGRIIDINRFGGGIRSVYVSSLKLFGAKTIGVVGGDLEFQSDERLEYNNEGLENGLEDPSDPENIFNLLKIGEKLLDQKESITALGLFAKMEIELLPSVFASFGLRYDNNKFKVRDQMNGRKEESAPGITMDAYSPMAGVSYRISRQFNIFANYSTAFQTPTMNEMGNSPTGNYGFNTKLLPETIGNIELGMLNYFKLYNLFTSFSIYRLKIKNMLVPYQNPNSESDETYYRNAGEAINYGGDLSLEWFFSGNITGNFSATLSNFSYENLVVEHSENDSTKVFQLSGNKVPGIPDLRISAGIKFLLSPFSGEVFFRYVDKYFTNDFNGFEPSREAGDWEYINDSYYTFDIFFNFEESINIGKLFIFSGINNIFNVRYNASIVPNASGRRFFEPSSSRYWFLGAKFYFGD